MRGFSHETTIYVDVGAVPLFVFSGFVTGYDWLGSPEIVQGVFVDGSVQARLPCVLRWHDMTA